MMNVGSQSDVYVILNEQLVEQIPLMPLGWHQPLQLGTPDDVSTATCCIENEKLFGGKKSTTSVRHLVNFGDRSTN